MLYLNKKDVFAMQIKFTMELFGHTISNSINIPEYDLNGISEEEYDDFIYDYINNEINNNIQLYIEDISRDDE